MTTTTGMTRSVALAATALALYVGCVDLTPPWVSATTDAGRTYSSPDLPSSGGAADVPLAADGSGGVRSQGGSLGGGGSSALAGSDGGVADVSIATGGAPATGGVPATGGAPAADGAVESTVDSGAVGTTGGAKGSGGASGKGGATGGATGTGGTIVISCAKPVVPDNGNPPTSGLLTDFSHWDPAVQQWGRSDNIAGTVFKTAGTGAIVSDVKVEGEPVGMHIAGVMPGGSRASGGLQFLTCATVSSFSYLRFLYYGSVTGCSVDLLIHTFSQSTVGGGCKLDGGTCGDYPRISGAISGFAAAPTPVTKPLSSFKRSTGAWTTSDAQQVVGIEWVFSSGDSPCNFDVTITEVAFLQ